MLIVAVWLEGVNGPVRAFRITLSFFSCGVVFPYGDIVAQSVAPLFLGTV